VEAFFFFVAIGDMRAAATSSRQEESQSQYVALQVEISSVNADIFEKSLIEKEYGS